MPETIIENKDKNINIKLCGLFAATLLTGFIAAKAIEIAALHPSPYVKLLAGGTAVGGIVVGTRILDKILTLKNTQEHTRS